MITDAISCMKSGFLIHFSKVSLIPLNFGLLFRSLLQQFSIKSWTTFGQLQQKRINLNSKIHFQQYPGKLTNYICVTYTQLQLANTLTTPLSNRNPTYSETCYIYLQVSIFFHSKGRNRQNRITNTCIFLSNYVTGYSLRLLIVKLTNRKYFAKKSHICLLSSVSLLY